MLIELCQRLLAHVSSGDGQKAAGEYFSEVGDENEALAIINAARSTSNSIRRPYSEHRRQCLAVAFALLFRPALKQEATIVLCFRALDGHAISITSPVIRADFTQQFCDADVAAVQ